MQTNQSMQPIQTNEPKYRVAFTVVELQSLLELAKQADPIEMMPICQKLSRAIAKANAGITQPAYVASTQTPGMATIARIQQSEAEQQGAALHTKLLAGESLTDNETFLAIDYLVKVRKQAPSHPAEIAAMEVYMMESINRSL